jgi:hypothetical protein
MLCALSVRARARKERAWCCHQSHTERCSVICFAATTCNALRQDWCMKLSKQVHCKKDVIALCALPYTNSPQCSDCLRLPAARTSTHTTCIQAARALRALSQQTYKTILATIRHMPMMPNNEVYSPNSAMPATSLITMEKYCMLMTDAARPWDRPFVMQICKQRGD